MTSLRPVKAIRPAYLRVSFEAKKYQVFGKRKHVTIPLKHFIDGNPMGQMQRKPFPVNPT